jgi:hypothetical protein
MLLEKIHKQLLRDEFITNVDSWGFGSDFIHKVPGCFDLLIDWRVLAHRYEYSLKQ